jgi:Domain of Unknown Function (DUF1080)
MRKNSFESFFIVAFLGISIPVFSQTKVSFDDMAYWQTSEKTNWQVASKVAADLNKNYTFNTEGGKGVLVNLPDKENKLNLISVAEYGDVDVTFEFMMAKNSNSGFYLQGRYEVQLLDSWGVAKPSTGDCGGIYKRRRWENGKEILWEGHTPRVNACIAPGLWQKMEISFQAPRFDASGKKTTNAKVLRIALNGVTIHENVELTGQTGGPIAENEVAKGPFMIQGDHGPVAFRNMIVKDLSGEPTTLKSANYQFYKGILKEKDQILAAKPDLAGNFNKLTWELSDVKNEFAEVINGVVSVKKAGKYRLRLQTAGNCELSVNGKPVLPWAMTYTWTPRNVEVDLAEGDVPFQIIFTKVEGFLEPTLGFWVESNSHRPVAMHDFTSVALQNPADPIAVDAKEPTVFRSFMDVKLDNGKTQRISHAASVGNPHGVHYTYNLDNGAIVQIWKGDFLNATPMWDNRGNGSSLPRGVVLNLGNNSGVCTEVGVSVGKDQTAVGTTIPAFKNELGYKSLGYDVDKSKLPTFRYEAAGAVIEDQIRISDDRKMVNRTLSIAGTPNQALFARMAVAKVITKINDDTYSIGDNGFYIKAGNATIQKQGDMSALVAPLAGGKVSYSVLW